MLESSFAVDDPSDIELYSDNKKWMVKGHMDENQQIMVGRRKKLANDYDLCH